MQKKFKYLFWLIIIIYQSAFSLIDKEFSSSSNANYNATGIIINENYTSDLAVTPNIIQIYRYVEFNEATQVIKNNTIEKLTSINKYENILFVLIPRKYGVIEKTNHNISSYQILRMNNYLNANYLSPSIKSRDTIITNQYLIKREVQSYLQPFNHYLIEQKLINNFSEEKQATINKSILGSHGLFMPPNMQLLNKFNGYGRTLPLAVSTIEELLLTADDFDIAVTDITKDQFINAQFLIFKSIELAKTVIFLPEFTTNKNTGEIRLPIALINKVSLDVTSGQITLNLSFCRQATNNYLGFFNFIDARNSLLKINDKFAEWEFIYYKFELNSSDNLKSLKYKATTAEIKTNGYINEQDNYIEHEITDKNIYLKLQNQHYSNKLYTNEEDLLIQSILPDIEELSQINLDRESDSYIDKFFWDLLLTYDHHNKNINKKLSKIQKNKQKITREEQEILIKKLVEYKNYSFKNQCNHYYRKCLVKFDCCDKYWCCHTDHQKNTKCSGCNKDTIAADISSIQCLICNHKQPFSKYCQRCNTRFADYFCNVCQHLTGIEYSPFHCEKCKICRIEGDMSFHCDVCGTCFHVSDTFPRNLHKCRQNSAHDECCICLEDTFIGCQIFPCTHKIHAQCKDKMVEQGITTCPVCRAPIAN